MAEGGRGPAGGLLGHGGSGARMPDVGLALGIALLALPGAHGLRPGHAVAVGVLEARAAHRAAQGRCGGLRGRRGD
eukprot:1867056-Pyramimonas_sp.AAC.1